ncbi:hypothetical protein HOK00_08730 [bacterium]|jgi:spore coat polysaccharide biosynthesis protein SpsF|nr:hypothetical protein [bacterium]
MLIIIQGRMLSSRLPGKGFFTFFDELIINRICRIAKGISGNNTIVFATGDNEENQIILDYIKDKDIEIFVGSEDNVLERFVNVINKHKEEDIICRLTADNYLIQPTLLDELYYKMIIDESQYAYIDPLSHYAGEIINKDILLDLYNSEYSEYSKEHVTWDIRQNINIKKTILDKNYFNINHLDSITLDTVYDLIKMKEIENLYPNMKNVNCLEDLRGLNHN